MLNFAEIAPTQGFWTGKEWAREYPEAKLYTVAEARRICKTTSFDCLVCMVVDYGTDNEHIAL